MEVGCLLVENNHRSNGKHFQTYSLFLIEMFVCNRRGGNGKPPILVKWHKSMKYGSAKQIVITKWKSIWMKLIKKLIEFRLGFYINLEKFKLFKMMEKQQSNKDRSSWTEKIWFQIDVIDRLMSENEKLNRKLEEAHKSSTLLSLGIHWSPSSYLN